MSQSFQSPTPSGMTFELDSRRLNRARRNFLDVNEQRLRRTQNSLNNRQQVFLDALPLLLHTNHPLLPGYVSHQTPCGVSGFEPNKHNIRAVRNIVKSFIYNQDRLPNLYIHNISLMGSCGTIAHSRSSDMDFWVCYQPGMNQMMLDELSQKLRGIEKWAASIGLEVYFFPMDLEEFKSGQRKSVSGEDCGSAQHYLLLDEFYRTSLLIAGRMPLWWMVPVEYERHYTDCAARLTRDNLVNTDEFIDFGGIPTIPAGEFIGAGMWQLYKGVESPYKSAIKILLTEVYASEYPQVNCLAHIYKDAIYQNKTNINELDPYVMLYRKLERYLTGRDEQQRLELMRRCFYFKANEPVGKPESKSSIKWRRNLMEKLVDEWEWKPHQLNILDSRKHWKVHRTIIERKALVNELNHSYRFLSRFARDYKSSIKISPQDMMILGRKLYAAFERKTGKIELVNPNITKHISEEDLTIIYTGSRSIYSTNNTWIIYSGHIELDAIDHHDPIKRGRSIVELIGWCYLNDILTVDTRVSLKADKSDLTEHELQRIIHTFHQAFPHKVTSAPQENFHTAHQPIHNLMFVNVGIDPMREWNQKGIQKITNQTDALNYSGMHTNLVQSIEQITINSWHEIIATQFEGDEAIIECILNFLRSTPPSTSPKMPKQEVLCFCSTRPEAISKRILSLLKEIAKCFYSNNGDPKHRRFLLEIENHYSMFAFNGNQPKAYHFSNYALLLKHLSKPQKHFSNITADHEALKQRHLRPLLSKIRPNQVQVFFCDKDRQTEIYLIDELGSIQYFSCLQSEREDYLHHLHQFLHAIWYRLESELNRKESYKHEPILFYELPKTISIKGKTHLTPYNATKSRQKEEHYYAVEVMVQYGEDKQPNYTIYCNHKEFSELEFGNTLFYNVAKHLLAIRQKNERYPVYITDIDLSQSKHNETPIQQTIQYLQYKLVLENSLNLALQKL